MKSISVIMAALMLSFLLCGCGFGYRRYSKTFVDYFDTAATVIGYEKSENDFNKRCDEIEKMLSFYHKQYDIYHTYEGINNICTVNKNAGAAPVTVDKSIIELLEFSKEMYSLTAGKMNVSMGSVLSVWHNYRKAGIDDPGNAKLPQKTELISAANHCDIENIIINTENLSVSISDPESSLDVGAVAKGYTTEIIAQKLKNEGVSGYALNIGGNVRTLGKKPDGKNWSAGVQNPNTESEDSYLVSVNVSDRSLVTSGSYQRFYTVDGEKYHHIIDPDTLMPENRFLSVSVLCNNSGKADALSTALFNLTLEDGKALLKKADAEAIWILCDGQIRYSEGAKEFVEKE